MAQNNFNNGPGGRLKKEEAKNVSFGFMRPEQRIIGEPSTTSVYQPTPEAAESRIYLQNRPGDFKNKVVADIANTWSANVEFMNPEQYKRVANIAEELNKKYGSPSWQMEKKRGFYNPIDNSLHIWPRIDKDPYANIGPSKNRPDVYFDELAHAVQVRKNPIKSAIRALKGIALYEDNKKPNVGRYGTPGEFEYEAHSEIAPRLWDEFKTLYKRKYKENVPPQYENRYEVSQLIADTPKAEGGTLKFKGKMLPEIEVVQPVKRP